MASKTYEVKLTGENAGLLRKLVESGSAVEKTTSKMSGDASHHSGLIGRSFARVGSAASTTAKDIVANLGVPVVGSLVGVGLAAVHLADNFEASQARLQGAVKNAGGNWSHYSGQIDYANSRLENLGFTNADAESSLSTLVNASHNVGGSIHLMGLAADIARGRNMSLGDATNILAKVQTGHVALLGRLGIATKDSTGHTISQQAALMRLAQVYGGDASRYADTFAGKQAVVGAKTQDAGAKLGQWLIPKLEAFASFIVNTVIPAISHLVDWVQTNWPRIYAAIAPTLAKAEGYIKGFVSTVQSLWNRFGNTILRYVVGVWNSVKLIIQGTMNVIMGVVRLFSDLFQGNWGKLWNDVKEIVRGVWELIRGLIGSAINQIETILALAWGAIGNAVHSGWSNTLSFFEGLPGKIAGFLVSLPGDMFNLGVKIIQRLIDGAMSMIGNLGSSIGGAIKGALSHIPGAGLLKGLASGGIVNFPASGGLAVLHGREAVIPLDNPRRAGEILGQIGGGGTVAPMSAGLGGLSGGGSPVVIVNLNGHFLGANSQLVPEVALAIENQLMRHGQNGAGARWTRRLTSTGPG